LTYDSLENAATLNLNAGSPDSMTQHAHPVRSEYEHEYHRYSYGAIYKVRVLCHCVLVTFDLYVMLNENWLVDS